MKAKGYKPLRKTLAYMRRMINTGKWEANHRIPTLDTIARRASTSVNTVRKAIKHLEYDRLIDNNGSLGFCVIPPDVTKLFHTDRQLYYLKLIRTNLQNIEMIDKGGMPIGKYIVLKNTDTLEVRNVLSGTTIKTTIIELRNSIQSPILLSSLIALPKDKLEKKRSEYFKQKDLREIAKVLLKHEEIKGD